MAAAFPLGPLRHATVERSDAALDRHVADAAAGAGRLGYGGSVVARWGCKQMSHKLSPRSVDRRRTLYGVATSVFGWLFGAAGGRRNEAVADEAAKPRSPTFEEFRFSFFEDPDSARDQLVTAPLLELHGEERALAEQMLLDFLPDGRAIIGLGLLRSKRAKPRLLEIFAAERIKAIGLYATRESDVTLLDLIWSAQALWRIQPSLSYAQALIENLRASANDTDRSEAAAALADMPIPEVDSALLGCLDDPDTVVRYHVARSLLLIHGQTPNDLDVHSVMARIGSNDPERRGSGKRDLLAAISNKPLVPARD
jgi:hypothetical protein